MHVGLSLDLSINVRLSGDLLVDVGLGSGVYRSDCNVSPYTEG